MAWSGGDRPCSARIGVGGFFVDRDSVSRRGRVLGGLDEGGTWKPGSVGHRLVWQLGLGSS